MCIPLINFIYLQVLTVTKGKHQEACTQINFYGIQVEIRPKFKRSHNFVMSY